MFFSFSTHHLPLTTSALRWGEKAKSMDKPPKKLDAWKEAIFLIVRIYELADKFPKSEAFGLSSQIKRAVLSMVANISEGAARQTKREFR